MRLPSILASDVSDILGGCLDVPTWCALRTAATRGRDQLHTVLIKDLMTLLDLFESDAPELLDKLTLLPIPLAGLGACPRCGHRAWRPTLSALNDHSRCGKCERNRPVKAGACGCRECDLHICVGCVARQLRGSRSARVPALLHALSKVAKHGDRAVISAVCARVADSDIRIHVPAMKALPQLAKVGDPDVIAALCARVGNASGYRALDAMKVLLQVAPNGEPTVIAAVCAKLGEDTYQTDAFEALPQVVHKGDQATIATLCTHLDNMEGIESDESIDLNLKVIRKAKRKAAMRALAQIAHQSDPVVISAVCQKLADSDSNVRSVAVEVLPQVAPRDDATTITAISAKLELSDAGVQGSAVQALARVVNAQDAISKMLHLQSHHNQDVRCAAMVELGEIVERGESGGDHHVTGILIASLDEMWNSLMKAWDKWGSIGFSLRSCSTRSILIATLRTVGKVAEEGCQGAIKTLIRFLDFPRELTDIRFVASMSSEEVGDSNEYLSVGEAVLAALGEIAAKGDAEVVAALTALLMDLAKLLKQDPEVTHESTTERMLQESQWAVMKAVEVIDKIAGKGLDHVTSALIHVAGISRAFDTARGEAVKALGHLARYGNPEVVSAFISLLRENPQEVQNFWQYHIERDDDFSAKYQAARALGEVAEKGNQHAIDALIALLNEQGPADDDVDDIQVRCEAITALCHISKHDNRQVISTLTSILKRPPVPVCDLDDSLNRSAAEALGRIAKKGNGPALKGLIELLDGESKRRKNDDDDTWRESLSDDTLVAALRAVGNISEVGDQRVIPTVITFLEPEGVPCLDLEVRSEAVRVIANIVRQGDLQVISMLVALLEDRHHKRDAAMSLSKLGFNKLVNTVQAIPPVA